MLWEGGGFAREQAAFCVKAREVLWRCCWSVFRNGEFEIDCLHSSGGEDKVGGCGGFDGFLLLLSVV